MPTISVTTCGRCGRTHDPKWRAGVLFVVTRTDKGADKVLFSVEDACRWCADAFEKRIKDFAAAFTAERKPRKKKERDSGDDSAPLDEQEESCSETAPVELREPGI